MSQKYKQNKKLENAFGKDEFGFTNLPFKISGTTLSRFIFLSDSGSCSYCFPHGFETLNSTAKKSKNNHWKRYRKTRWKDKKCLGVYVEEFSKFWSSLHSQLE